MKRIVLMSIVVSLLTAGSVVAHHGYGEYDRNAPPVTLEGTLQRVQWANPHVLFTLETQNKGEYSVEWMALSQLSAKGIKAFTLKAGDHLVVTGSINRNPEKRILTLLTEISRPADGWHWVNPWANPNRASTSSTNKWQRIKHRDTKATEAQSTSVAFVSLCLILSPV